MFAWRGVLHNLVRVLHRQIAPFLLTGIISPQPSLLAQRSILHEKGIPNPTVCSSVHVYLALIRVRPNRLN